MIVGVLLDLLAQPSCELSLVLVGDVLYAATRPLAPEGWSKKDGLYVAAVDVTSGKVLFRSAPLVSSIGILPLGPNLVTAYGFENAPALVVLGGDTGEVVAEAKLQSSPTSITVGESELTVTEVNAVETFSIR